MKLGVIGWVVVSGLSGSRLGLAQSVDGAAGDTTRVELPQVEVIGRRADALLRLPGSASLISTETIDQAVPLSGNELFRRVPGVHVQEEEGAGMRANIGIRGLDPDRSRTVLVLEDGVPVALAPYGEPEMYYTPPIERMSRVELLKGSGSILFGPQTIGGVINYITADAPAELGGNLSLLGGRGGFQLGKLSVGGTFAERLGARLGGVYKAADNLNGLRFRLADVTGKLAYDLTATQRLGLKLSFYDETSNSTYVGLTQAMFETDPTRHPAPDDRLDVRRLAATGSHRWLLGSRAIVTTTLYGYTTQRDWRRRDYGYNAAGDSLLFRATTGSRDRGFQVVGIEPRLQFTHTLLGRPSELEAGVRLHGEFTRDQHVNGRVSDPDFQELRDDEKRTGVATAVFAQSRVSLSPRVQLIPGVRLERVSLERQVLRTRRQVVGPDGVPVRDSKGALVVAPQDVDITSTDQLMEVIPGVGLNVQPTAEIALFVGVHRGFAPPRTKDAFTYSDRPGTANGELVALDLDAERSWNYEVGARRVGGAVTAEATGFLLDFSNQIIAPSASSGASAAQLAFANQGATRHAGFEGALGVDAGRLVGSSWSVTAEAKLTLVRATFSRDRLFVRSGDTVNVRGNRLPYAPERTVSLGFGLSHPTVGVSLRLDGTFVAQQFTDNFETVTASANGRNGLIPGYELWDLAASYTLGRPNVRLTATVKNLFDRTLILSRRPEGIKASLPRQILGGVSVSL